jgi:enoyl-CoA hydratase/carnithine racemase
MAEHSSELSVEEETRDLRARMEVSRLLHEIPKATIAMVNGPAAGAGSGAGGEEDRLAVVATLSAIGWTAPLW